jgi:GTPase SAR1 family protein
MMATEKRMKIVNTLCGTNSPSLFTKALVIGVAGSGKSHYISELVKHHIDNQIKPSIFIVAPTVKQYQPLLDYCQDVAKKREAGKPGFVMGTEMTLLNSIESAGLMLKSAEDSLIIFDDISKPASLAPILEVSRNNRNTVYNLTKSIDLIKPAMFSEYNLFVVFRNSHSLVLSRLYKNFLSDLNSKENVQEFYKHIKQNQFKYSKFIININNPRKIMYFLLDADNQLYTDPSLQFV